MYLKGERTRQGQKIRQCDVVKKGKMSFVIFKECRFNVRVFVFVFAFLSMNFIFYVLSMKN